MGMLVLSRKTGQGIECTISAEQLRELAARGEPLVLAWSVREVHGQRVKMAIDAPLEMRVRRTELAPEGESEVTCGKDAA